MPEQQEQPQPQKPKSIAQLQADYDGLCRKCQEAHAAGVKLELKLMEELRKKLKQQAGDVTALLQQKHQALIALEAAKNAGLKPREPLPSSAQEQLARRQ